MAGRSVCPVAFLSCSKPICPALSALAHGDMRAWRAIPQWGRGPLSSRFASTIGRRSRCTSLCAASLSRDDPVGRRRRRAATSPALRRRTQARSRQRREDQAASKRRKRPQETAIRDLIETERHAARLKPEPPFDEGREAIARHCGCGSKRAQLPRQTHEDCGAGRKNNSCSEASPSLGTTE